jgi:hypothetical protein
MSQRKNKELAGNNSSSSNDGETTFAADFSWSLFDDIDVHRVNHHSNVDIFSAAMFPSNSISQTISLSQNSSTGLLGGEQMPMRSLSDDEVAGSGALNVQMPRSVIPSLEIPSVNGQVPQYQPGAMYGGAPLAGEFIDATAVSPAVGDDSSISSSSSSSVVVPQSRKQPRVRAANSAAGAVVSPHSINGTGSNGNHRKQRKLDIILPTSSSTSSASSAFSGPGTGASPQYYLVVDPIRVRLDAHAQQLIYDFVHNRAVQVQSAESEANATESVADGVGGVSLGKHGKVVGKRSSSKATKKPPATVISSMPQFHSRKPLDYDPLQYFRSILNPMNSGSISDMTAALNRLCSPDCLFKGIISQVSALFHIF